MICKTENDKNLIKETIFLFRFHLKELIYAINVIRFSENSIEKLDQIQYDILFTILKSNSYSEQEELFTFIIQFIFFRLEKTQTFLYAPFVKSEFNNNEIEEEVMKDSSIKYKFGLRIKFENDVLEWLDLDLAINSFILFIQKLKDKKYSDSMSILLYFINKIKPNGLIIYNKNQNKNKFVKKMKVLNSKDKDFFMPFDSLNESSEKIFTFANDVQSYMANITIGINKINENYQELENYYNLFKQNLNSFNKKLTNIIEKEYLISFNSFIINDSICKSIIINNRGIKFRRDNILCIDYCPFKVFKHFSFDKECIENENLFTIPTKLESNQQITLINVKSNQKIVIKSDDIDYVLFSHKNKKRRGFQILTKSGKNYNLIFSEESSQYFDLIWNTFDSMEYIDKTKILKTDTQIKLKLKEITSLWIDNKISNFDYLMILNFLSGRNFNDFNQYPVFPWILTDYTSDILDLNDPKSYRDLSKPVGAFSKKRLQKIKNRLDNYYYSTGYSNCYSVLNWLCRLEPFSSKSQNQELYTKFESISDSFIDVSNNDNDFRELIPEFFFLPEFLMSFNGDNVVLPPWSNNSPIEFIYKHRKALESKFVSSNINNWIDLIWGYKQDGIESYNANNVFAPEMNEFGQIPIKLFEKKHPERKIFVSPSSLFSSFSINFTNISPPVIFYVSSAKKVTGSEKVIILTFKMVDSKGNFFTHIFDLGSNVYEKNEVELKCTNKIIIDDSKPIFINSNIIGFIDNDNMHVNFFNCEKSSTEKIRIQDYEIELIESDQQGNLIIFSADSSVTLFNINLLNFSNTGSPSLVKRISSKKMNFLPQLHINDSQKKLSSSTSNLLSPSENSFSSECSNSFYTYKYKIECVGISQAFKTFVCGTRDYCVLFCQLNLSEMKINRVVHVNGRPKKIVITENMGLVVILLKKLVDFSVKQELALYNINGEFIRSLEYDDKTLCEMTCASSMPGCFDYLIVADDLNRIFILEAFSLKFEEIKFRCNSKIIQLKYIREESLIIAICDDGCVNVIFYYIDESKDQ